MKGNKSRTYKIVDDADLDKEAYRILLRDHQYQNFREVFDYFRSNKCSKDTPMLVKRYNVYLHEKGLLRVKEK